MKLLDLSSTLFQKAAAGRWRTHHEYLRRHEHLAVPALMHRPPARPRRERVAALEDVADLKLRPLNRAMTAGGVRVLVNAS